MRLRCSDSKKLSTFRKRHKIRIYDLCTSYAASSSDALHSLETINFMLKNETPKFVKEEDLPRPAINIFIDCAAPQIADPTAKKRMNARTAGFRPTLDTRPPTRGRTAVEAMPYALPTHRKFGT
jgi:hypothetical protein